MKIILDTHIFFWLISENEAVLAYPNLNLY